MTVLLGTQEADIRPVRPDELPACAAIWRRSINDYTERLGRAEIPDDLAAVMTLYRHLQETDPERFIVAGRLDGDGADRVVGFAAAVVRAGQWFLSMLFLEPEEQGVGLGRTLLERVLPPAGSGLLRATCTDSAQPISNGLYSRYGMLPRLPLLDLVGGIRHPESLPDLPAGVVATAFEAIVEGAVDGHRKLAAAVDDLDREVAGFDHPTDHRWIRTVGRRGYLYRDGGADDSPVLGYGYGSDVGRIGPIAVRDEALMGPAVAHLLRSFEPRGAFAVWVPGAATGAVTTLLDAGLRIEGFPLLLCWDRVTTDFSRYLPISPGLL